MLLNLHYDDCFMNGYNYLTYDNDKFFVVVDAFWCDFSDNFFFEGYLLFVSNKIGSGDVIDGN